jgi:hypothetical protein
MDACDQCGATVDEPQRYCLQCGARRPTARCGRAGALAISPQIMRGSSDAAALGPYALQRTIADLLALKPLGHAEHARSVAKLVA